jgi:ATP-dependent helicase/DNAse subunit B
LKKIFGVLCDLFDRIATILGDSTVSRPRFIELLSLLFSSVSLGTIPMLQDAVTVMSAMNATIAVTVMSVTSATEENGRWRLVSRERRKA